MPAPKDPTRLKRAKSGPLKMECYACSPPAGRSRPAIYASRGQIAEHGAPLCAVCGAPFMFADAEVCALVQPQLADDHPVIEDERARTLAQAARDEREHAILTCDCGAPAPRGSRAESWYCGRCATHHTIAADGDHASQRLKSGTGYWEEAHYRETRLTESVMVPARINYPRNRRPEIVPARSWRDALQERDETDRKDTSDDLPF